MNRLVRNAVVMVAVLLGAAQGFLHRQAPAAGASPQVAVASEGYNPWGKAPPVAQTAHAAPPQPQVLLRDASGQFHVTVTVNGRDTRFLVDTGADVVALTPQSAQDLGLHVAPQDYQPVLRTASGTGMGVPVWLDSVEVSGRRLDHQRAVVAQGLGENLLGQSVLRSLGRVELQGDTMVLVPN